VATIAVVVASLAAERAAAGEGVFVMAMHRRPHRASRRAAAPLEIKSAQLALHFVSRQAQQFDALIGRQTLLEERFELFLAQARRALPEGARHQPALRKRDVRPAQDQSLLLFER